jgi:S-methylmethionine-dependent homocysteine/selenocysteine methylase
MLDEARSLGLGAVLDSVTWRASHGWGTALGLTPDQIDQGNRDAVAFARDLRDARPGQEIVVNGVVGPHGDAYAPDSLQSPEAARAYHARQVRVLADAGVDMISAMTIGSAGEAVGIATAAREAGCPVVVSFTVETDGRLPSDMPLEQAVAETDRATDAYPVW